VRPAHFLCYSAKMIIENAKKLARLASGRPRQIADEEQAYRKLLARGYQPAGIIDVGAYKGNWTRMARRVFTKTPTLMIEAQVGKEPFLREVCLELPGVEYVSAVLGSAPGKTVTFYEMETGSSMMSENSNVPRKEFTLVTRTLDEVAAAMAGSLFLKIDVQGAELEVLGGGAATLERAEVVQLEVAMLPYNTGAPTFLQVISYMDERGFVPLDFSGFTRPNGRDLVQVDILFTKRDAPLRPTFFTF
jgi:FkbM family methyltransferase